MEEKIFELDKDLKNSIKLKSRLQTLSKSKELKELSKIKSKILKALGKCIDPELGENVIDLGFIYNIDIKKSKDGKGYEVEIFMTLTSPFCPMANYITSIVEENIKKIKSVSKLNIEIVFEPQWNPSMLSKDLQFAFFKQFMGGSY